MIKLLRRWELFHHEFYAILQDLHTYGVYIPPGMEINTALQTFFNQNGVPLRLWQKHTGKVLLCLNAIKRALNQYQQCQVEIEENKQNDEQYDQKVDPKTDVVCDQKQLFSKLVTYILIHEHCHGITFEGLGSGDNVSFRPLQREDNKQESEVVSETLAEWAGLNYFRNDHELYDLIWQHANSGDYPEWPYAGALKLETSPGLLPLSIKFVTLLNYYRSDPAAAYKLFNGF